MTSGDEKLKNQSEKTGNQSPRAWWAGASGNGDEGDVCGWAIAELGCELVNVIDVLPT